MARHAKTQQMIDVAHRILAQHHPMTVRQVYYQLVSRQVIENNMGRYKAVCKALVAARLEGAIPWEWIEDRVRIPRRVHMWNGLPHFGVAVCNSYRRNVWSTQSAYLETWVEKDALSGIFEDVLDLYGVTLNVGRGYDGWSSIHNAAYRFRDGGAIIYFGDFDPSGEDMVRSLRDRLGQLGATPEIVKCALTADDIKQYNLPPDCAKRTDTRSSKFIAEHGDVSVELDALPIDVLKERIKSEIEARMDMDALEEVLDTEAEERKRLEEMMKEAG